MGTLSFTIYEGASSAHTQRVREPDVVALEALLRFCGVPSTAVRRLPQGTPYMTDRLVLPVLHIHRLPAVDDNQDAINIVVSGWYAIRSALVSLGVLSVGQCAAQAESLVSMVRDRLDLGRLYEWWHIEANYLGMTKRYWADLHQLPFLARWSVPRQEREAVRTRLLMQSAAFRQLLRRSRTGTNTSAEFSSLFEHDRQRERLASVWSSPSSASASVPATDAEASAEAEFWMLEIEPMLEALEATLGQQLYFQTNKASSEPTDTIERSNGPTSAPGYVDAVVYGHLVVYLQTALPTGSRMRALIEQRPALLRYVQRIQSTYMGEEAAAVPSPTDAGANRSVYARTGPHHVASGAFETAGVAETTGPSNKSMTPEEEAAYERRLANRTFIWLAAGSFIFYALFGAALDFRIGED
ncbi:hypothetical protein CCYA_CCYA16G4145 [Cyanidiococcus yangmingshanensis]|nr:hypothetical protein CCYA_CCYA16G4145 [Cyanidiococcus yangmingshanensis]